MERLWRARTDGRCNEVVFLAPSGQAHRAVTDVSKCSGLGKGLEVYLRELGSMDAHRRDGWTVAVPSKVRALSGWVSDPSGKRNPKTGRYNPKLIRYLRFESPDGRKTLLELKRPAPKSLLSQIKSQLADEVKVQHG